MFVDELEQRLLDILTALKPFGDGDPRVVPTLQNLTQFYFVRGDRLRAAETAERALTISEKAAESDQENLGAGLVNRAVIAAAEGDIQRADDLLRRAVEVWRRIYGPEHERLAVAQNNRCVILGDKKAGEDALSIAQANFGPRHPLTGEIMNNLGVIACRTGDLNLADVLLKRALEIWQRTLGQDHPFVGLSLMNLGSLYRRQEEHFVEAEEVFQRGWPLLDDNAPLDGTSTFAMSRGPYLETGLLRPVVLRARPLWIDQPKAGQWLPGYAASVQQLKNAVASSPSRTQDLIAKLGPWYHNVRLAPGLETNPPIGDHPVSRWRALEEFVPKDLRGKTVLDVGCNTGFFSMEMKKRGASRVVGIDVMPHVLSQARFLSAWFEQPVELREMDVYNVESLGTFDFVVFLGTLYHLKHPLYALEKLALVCKQTMFFNSAVRGALEDFESRENYSNEENSVFELAAFPKLYLIEKSFNGDASNWWFANRSALKAMLRIAGFPRIESTSLPDTFVCHKA